MMVLSNRLIRAYFLWLALGRAPLDSHECWSEHFPVDSHSRSTKIIQNSRFMSLPSLKLTYPLKMDGWKTIVSFWVSAHFQVRTVSFREGQGLQGLLGTYSIAVWYWASSHILNASGVSNHLIRMLRGDWMPRERSPTPRIPPAVFVDKDLIHH